MTSQSDPPIREQEESAIARFYLASSLTNERERVTTWQLMVLYRLIKGQCNAETNELSKQTRSDKQLTSFTLG